MQGQGSNPASGIEIAVAAERDLDGILALQERNLAERGGTLSARLSRAQLQAMIGDLPGIVARRAGRVVGYLLASSKATIADVPVVRAMLEAYPGAADAYLYGPIAVDESARGQGIAAAMFERLKALVPGREGILFIREDNAPSLRAHAKMGIAASGTFLHAGTRYVVLSYK